MFIHMKPFHSTYQEANSLGTHHSYAGNETAIFKILSHLQQELKDRQRMRKGKNMVLRLKKVILKYWSAQLWPQPIWCWKDHPELFTAELWLSGLYFLKTQIFWDHRIWFMKGLRIQNCRRSQLHICFHYKKCKVFWNVSGLRHLKLDW